MTQFTMNFSLEELTVTEHRTIENHCPKELLPDLMETAVMMEKIRDCLSRALGVPCPVHLNSAYRSPELNVAIGGAANSDHCKAKAADFVSSKFGTPAQIARLLVPIMEELGIQQIILEFGRWVHVSRHKPEKTINRVLTASRVAGKTVYTPGLS
jgi:zinc D-Ala-D-Ala carboxypeptidase